VVSRDQDELPCRPALSEHPVRLGDLREGERALNQDSQLAGFGKPHQVHPRRLPKFVARVRTRAGAEDPDPDLRTSREVGDRRDPSPIRDEFERDVESLVGWKNLPDKVKERSKEMDAFVENAFKKSNPDEYFKRVHYVSTMLHVCSDAVALRLLDTQTDRLVDANIFVISVTIAPTLENDSMSAILNFTPNSSSTATIKLI